MIFEAEKFRILGFDVGALQLDGCELRDLTGEAMSLIAVTMVTYAMLLCFPYSDFW